MSCFMKNEPWLGDACSLVEAFRAGDLSPTETLEASLAAIEASQLNAFSHVDAESARAAAAADVSLPFGGVPIAVKELESVAGWPYTEASLVFRDRLAKYDSTQVARLRAAGAVITAQTTASEFGASTAPVRSSTEQRATLGTRREPRAALGRIRCRGGGRTAAIGLRWGRWRLDSNSRKLHRLFGLKSTFGRIPRGPYAQHPPLTVTVGCVSRSVRDTARWFDTCNGFDPRDTLSLPRVDGWEAGLASFDLAGKRAVISIDLGNAIVEPVQTTSLIALAEQLITQARLKRVDLAIQFPNGGFEWSLSNLIGLAGALGDRYPACHDDLTTEIQFGMSMATKRFSLQSAGAAEMFRIDFNEQMADIFEQTDFIFAATNPDVAFAAAGPMATTVGTVDLVAEHGFNKAISNNGVLTIPANLTGNPAITIPAGLFDGLPIGLQIIGRHHEEQLLLDLARIAEREHPWPLVAPSTKS